MNNTCDGCKHYNLIDGECRKHNEIRRSCVEDCCCDFEIDPLLKQILEDKESVIFKTSADLEKMLLAETEAFYGNGKVKRIIFTKDNIK